MKEISDPTYDKIIENLMSQIDDLKRDIVYLNADICNFNNIKEEYDKLKKYKEYERGKYEVEIENLKTEINLFRNKQQEIKLLCEYKSNLFRILDYYELLSKIKFDEKEVINFWYFLDKLTLRLER